LIHVVDRPQPHQHGLRLGASANLGYVVALAEQLCSRDDNVLVVPARLHDLAPLLRLERFELVFVALLPRQVMDDQGEAVRENAVDAYPPHPAAKAELILSDQHLHVALDRLAPRFFEQRVEEPDRSREQQSSRGHIVVEYVQPA
jgi:hypothetical protein